MRIVGGRCRGRVLSSFKGMSIRPTSDKVREAVFNILPRDFPFKKVLDLFAGTGALGIEALSRGSEEAVFIDSDPRATELVRKNLASCGLLEAASVYRRDSLSAIRFLSERGKGFDLIFIDPPYASALAEETLKAVDAAGLLNEGGTVVAETSRRNPIEVKTANLVLLDERRYGDTLIYFYSTV